MLPVGVEGDDDVDAESLGDEVAGLEGGALAAVDRVADDVGAGGPGDVGRPSREPSSMTRTCVGQPGHLGRDLGQDAGQAVGLVERRDADEHPAPGLAVGPALELGRRQRPDEPAHALVRAIGAAERVEDEQVGDRHETTSTVTSRPSGSPSRPEDVLDRPDQVREQGDAEQPEADEEEPGGGDATPGAASSKPTDRDEHEDDREGQTGDAQEADRHAGPV